MGGGQLVYAACLVVATQIGWGRATFIMQDLNTVQIYGVTRGHIHGHFHTVLEL